MKPFRWDISRVEQLGKLIDPAARELDNVWVPDVVDTSVKIVARSNGADLVFVGRSPEKFFDYLSGVFSTTSYAQSIHHFNISNRFVPFAQIRRESPEAFAALREHATLVGIDPMSILKSRHGMCFVDLVATGSTFGQLLIFLIDWGRELGIVTDQLIAKIHFVGITQERHTSPNTFRWQQHAEWVKTHSVRNVKNVSIPYRLWDLFGNYDAKVTPSNDPRRWTEDTALGPSRAEATRSALQGAYQLYCLGVDERREFGRKLAGSEAVGEAWLRRRLSELR